MKNLSIFLVLSILSLPCFSQGNLPEKYAEFIRAEMLEDNLTILASNALEGRATGTRGQKMAATFIASYFEEIGLESPMNGSYFQEVDLVNVLVHDINLNSGDHSFKYPKDFVYAGSRVSAHEVTDELVFMGFGKKSDFDQVDVKNKSVLVLSKDSTYSSLPTILELATKNEVSEMFYAVMISEKKLDVWWENHSNHLMTSGIIKLKNPSEEDKWQLFQVKQSVATRMMNTTNDKLFATAENFEKKHKKVKSTTVTYSFETTEKLTKGDNVLGFIEGTDKKDEVIVITAHYDHLAKKDGEGDIIYNGADDNGSGTVAIMNIAKAFTEAKKDGHGPRRSILFIAFTAEEVGLLGSKFYTQNPVFPLDKTIVNLNIDMIGRHDTLHDAKSPYVFLIGSDMLSLELHEISESANATYTNLELDYTYNDPEHPEMFIERSDQWNFIKKGIPAIFYLDGVHEDYHKPSDEVEKIDFDLLAMRTKLIFYTAWEIANRENSLKLNPQNDLVK